MGHLDIIGYLSAILIVVFIVWRNRDKQKEDDKERE
jgi:hypothetical protein